MEYKVLHLPKTGGTTLKSTLINDYRRHNNVYLKSNIEGLYFCNHEERYKEDISKYIIFLRDPIRRFESHFYFYKYNDIYDTSEYFNAGGRHLVDEYNINSFIENSESKKFKKFLSHHKSLDWMINSNNYKNIFFVGTQENLELDFYNLLNKINYKKIEINKSYTNKRPINLEKEEIKKSNILKLRNLFDKDYSKIKSLVDSNLLDKNYLKIINFDI
jgi:hypothetical protein